MKHPSQYAVVLDRPVYDHLLESSAAAAPAECYSFLAGRVVSPTVYRVTHAYAPQGQRGTPNSVEWTEEARIEATKWALDEGSHFLGWAHSHPYDDLHPFGACQSRPDARVQVENHFTLSLIVALYGRGRAAIGAWLLGYPAPLSVCTVSRGKLVGVRPIIQL
jgi:proteasome lid subunit RPN8/RPN11